MHAKRKNGQTNHKPFYKDKSVKKSHEERKNKQQRGDNQWLKEITRDIS